MTRICQTVTACVAPESPRAHPQADLACEFFCRLLQEMQDRRLTSCVPRINPGSKMELSEWSDFSSGYFQRAVGRLPKQGSHYPWKVNQNYLKDIVSLRYGALL